MATLTFMTHTIFDHGTSDQLGKVLSQNGVKRPLICTDKGLVELGLVSNLTQTLGDELEVSIYDGTPENPTQEAVETAVEQYRQSGSDGIVAFGGGSSMDLAEHAEKDVCTYSNPRKANASDYAKLFEVAFEA